MCRGSENHVDPELYTMAPCRHSGVHWLPRMRLVSFWDLYFMAKMLQWSYRLIPCNLARTLTTSPRLYFLIFWASCLFVGNGVDVLTKCSLDGVVLSTVWQASWFGCRTVSVVFKLSFYDVFITTVFVQFVPKWPATAQNFGQPHLILLFLQIGLGLY